MRIYPHLLIALSELGQAEIPGDKDNPRISEYLATVGMPGDDEIAWCSAFVNWCLKQADISGTGKPNAKSFLQWGYQTPGFKPGAVAVFNRGNQEWMGHVGFCLDETPSWLYILGGNQNDRVSIRPYSKSKLVSYRWSSEFI